MKGRDAESLSATSGGTAEPPDVVDALLGLWRARVLLLVTCAIGGLLALVYVARAPVLYTAQLTLTPSESSPSAGVSRLNSLASLAGISTGSHSGAPFDLFLLALQSRHVATVIASDDAMLKTLFPGRWNSASGRWVTTADAGSRFSLRVILGLPVAALGRPAPSEVNDMLNSRVEIGQSSERGTATVSFDDPDPAFAVSFVAYIARAADNFVKARTLARSTEYIGYIQGKLRTAALAEDREILAAELGARERSAMLASSGLPFAADPLGEPIASTMPSSPRLRLSLAIGIAVGFAFGLLILLFHHVRQRARAH